MKPKQSRNTKPKLIASLAKGDDWLSAHHIATHGRDLTLVEMLIFLFYDSLDDMSKAQSNFGRYDERFFATQERFRKAEKTICDHFLKALREHDADAIISIVKAMWYFEKMNGKLAHDPLRLKLLHILGSSNVFDRAPTLREIAEKVYTKKMFAIHAEDGFSALRKICKAMEIPTRPDRKISRKTKP